MENEVVVTKKGQTTIPARLRKRFNIEEGPKLEAVETDEGILFRLKKTAVDFKGDNSQFAIAQETKKLLTKLRGKRWSGGIFYSFRSRYYWR